MRHQTGSLCNICEREKEKVGQAFKVYFSPQEPEQLLQDPANVERSWSWQRLGQGASAVG